MEFGKFMNSFREALKEVKLLRFFVILLLGLVFLEFYLVVHVLNNQKIVLVPATLDRSVQVNPSPKDLHYIELLIKDVTYAYYNFTPDTVEDNYRYVLSFMAPSVYPKMQAELSRMAEEYSKTGASQMAQIETIKIYKDRAEVIAKVHTYVGKSLVNSTVSKLTVGYVMKGGRFMITSFVEETEHLYKEEEAEGGKLK